jgi:membrane-associated phospholipid phosphatase
VFPLAGLAAAALALTGRWLELAVLAAGLAATVVLTDEIKDWTDRTRPADGLVEVGGSAFPSAHASYATLYTWLAITLAVRVVPGLTRRGAVIGTGIAVTALVGLTRVYLDVHWLSDVSGGWALGLSAFAAAAAVALVAAHIRDNHGVDGRDRDNADERPAPGGRP